MDPWLERHWLDVHTKLVAYAADDLNRQLPEDLVASTEERVAVESADGGEHLLSPDVRVFEPADSVRSMGAGTGTALAPYRLLAQVEPITERYIQIVEVGAERTITIIEFVSKTNKHGEGLQAFRSKRAQLLESGVNFVEVDLVLAGNWKSLLRPHQCARETQSEYRVTFRLPSDPGAVYLYPIRLFSPLPTITIPLRPGDPPVQLNLQELLNQTYANGRYDRRLDYAKAPDPPLDVVQAAEARNLLRAAGR